YEGVAAPAVYLAGGSTLTIKGSGTLYTSGGYANVAIGAPNRDTMGTLIIESGKITAIGGVESESAHDAAPAIGVPIGGNQGGKLILKGGVLDAKGASGSDRGDINTEVVIDGGSLVSPVTIYNCGFNQYVPKNSSGREVYLTELTMEGVSGAVDIEYYVTTGSGTESDAISSALDENGKLYLYFPADGNYRKIRAHINDAAGEYFKRIKVTDDIENNKGELTKNPTGAITNFYIVGQNSSDIDEENNIITVKVPSLMDLTNCRPSVETGGLEYFPSGNVNFQDNPEITFSVVLDSGETVEYTVKIERVDSEADTMTVLDISAGNIIMFSEDLSTDPDDQTGIFIGDAAVVPNPNGYVITGESDTNFIYIEEITAPIVFRDLVINSPILNEEANAPLTVAGTSVNLEIEGVNEISGSAANSAMYLFEESSLSVSGGGILILRGGAGANGVAADNENHRFVIGDTSVFIIDGENTPEHSLANPVNEAGELLYPLIVTIDDINAADSEMIYSDTRYNAAGEIVSAVQSVKMLSDGSARLSLYKPAGYYEVSVLWNGDVYYSEDRTPVSSENTPGDPAEVTLTIPSISGLSFTDPESSLEQRVTVILSGTNLGGNMIVTATGENGEKVSAKALKNGDVWQAVLTIPANKSVTGVYRWTLSAKIGDIEQELSKTYYIDMWRKLAVTSFSIDEEKQVGDADIDHNNKLVTIVVPYDVDLETTNFRPKYEHTGDIFIGDWGGSMVNLFNPASVYLAYTSGAADEVIYNIRAQKQEAPSVAEISFEQPADYNGGDVVITLKGENLDNLTNASTDAAKRIVVSAAGKNVYVTRPVPDGEGGTAWQATVPVPDNINGAQTAKYPISITINSVEQEFKGPHEIIVPARIEALANIAGFAFSDAEGNPIEAVSVEITDGTVGSVNGGTSGTPGKIAVVLPSGTNLAETALIPSVALENPQANLRIIDAEGNEYGIGEAIIFTETNIPVTLAVVSEDGENTMSYELEVTVQTRRKGSGKSKNDNVTAGAVTYEAYAGGYEDNTFRPDNIITRAEAAALLARLDADFDETVPYESYEQSFYDVVPSNWYAKYIGYLAHEGVITGYEDGSFMPSKQITRMEFAALLSRFADSTGIELKDMEKELAGASARNVSGVNISTASASAQEAFTDMTKHIVLNALTASAAISDADWETAVPLSDISGLWGESHIVGLADAGVVSGYEDGTFRPENSTTRAETVTMLNRMLGRTVTSELRTAISDAENKFSDLSKMHWAYYDIMAAAHSYTVKTSTVKGAVNVTVELNK
ncbi:MAG: S-layer homology domain-containing protein, partial [Firmicutes bacterium]|nr:S-layer homology domain-containing protein [Bacillota bacterium]